MAKPDILPGYSVTELFPLHFGALAHRLSRDRTYSLHSEQAPSSLINTKTDSHEPRLENQPVIGGDLIEETPIDPGQLMVDLRDASSVFPSIVDPL